MFFIDCESGQAVAGTNAITIKKPAGDVVLRFISVNTAQAPLFPYCRGELSDAARKRHRGLYHSRPPNLGEPTVLWAGKATWRHGHTLKLRMRTQTALEIIYYSVGYDIVELPPGVKRRWGE